MVFTDSYQKLFVNSLFQNVKTWLESAVAEQNVPTLWKEDKSMSKL